LNAFCGGEKLANYVKPYALDSAACDATDITMKALSSAVGRNSQQGKTRNEYVRASTWIISPHKLKLIEN
jgi:hypothetical protein